MIHLAGPDQRSPISCRRVKASGLAKSPVSGPTPDTWIPDSKSASFIHHSPERGQNQSERCRLNHRWLSGDKVQDGWELWGQGLGGGGGGESCSQCALHRGPVDTIRYASSSCSSSPKRLFPPPFNLLLFFASVCRSDSLSRSVSQCESIYKKGRWPFYGLWGGVAIDIVPSWPIMHWWEVMGS